MNRATRRLAEQWLREARAAVVVEVAQADGSVPRGAGTRMLVDAGSIVGTIGGGHLEWKAIEAARDMLVRGDATREARYALGPSLGQCCGGAVTLRWSRLTDDALAAWPEPQPLFELQLYGAGHVGQAIARLLAGIDCEVDWIDEREAMFAAFDRAGPRTGGPAAPAAIDEGRVEDVASPWPPHIRPVAVDAVEAEVARANANARYLVLTHSHDLDLRITEAILRRGDFAFLGLIGSKTKRARFAHRFEAIGIDPKLIERITCPIGIEGIAGKEPEVIAVSVVAQLLRGR